SAAGGAPPLGAGAGTGARRRRPAARPPEAPRHRPRRGRLADADRVRPPAAPGGERGPSPDAPADPAARLGARLQPRVELPPPLRLARAPKDRARPRPAEVHPHGTGGRLSARQASTLFGQRCCVPAAELKTRKARSSVRSAGRRSRRLAPPAGPASKGAKSSAGSAVRPFTPLPHRQR